ncbi:MAG: NAD(P)(+) transhydrogenase (Re/Si-specific) subunit beta [Calditrichaeota bacterium]|nr:NAD(P)(+) transhydrogenase (Re/Si-specific) subunit beta [Calditrichota bacterium]
MGDSLLELSYLIASVSFILGLKLLSSPDSAKKGNTIAAFGMTLAIIATIFLHKKIHDDGSIQYIGNYIWIFAGIAVGTFIGWLMAVKVEMTAMPQMVSFFNGMGGACAAVISLLEFPQIEAHGEMLLSGHSISILLGLMIGSVSFSGSMIAFGKLNGNINDIRSSILSYVNAIIFIAVIGLAGFILMQSTIDMTLVYILLGACLVYGIFFVMPIGGADMPVVISLLNSFTGVAAACGGFLYGNYVMLTGGILVGSAGTILTVLMCNAMNRSLTNVIFGAFGGSTASAAGEGGGTVKEISITDAAVLLNYSQKVVIIPGYGLAVARAQHACNEMDKILEANGVSVKYGIHPVAGRMPGHMNVLLAEADVPYPKLVEMEDINGEMSTVDVAIVIGANDVVNPAAEKDPGSPIYGMPIIKALDAKHVIVMKRSMASGYAGIENELFYHDKTKMLFGDAKSSIEGLVAELKNL